MIVRTFTATPIPGKEAELENKILHGSTSLVKAQKSSITYYAGRSIGSQTNDFVMITIWKNPAAVKAFAGPEWKQSVISDTMSPLLKDHSLTHHEVFATPEPLNIFLQNDFNPSSPKLS